MSTPFNRLEGRATPPVRDEYICTPEPMRDAVLEAPLAASKRLANTTWLRKLLIAAVLIVLWEIAARLVDNNLLLPTFTDTLSAFAQGIWSGELIAKTAISMSVLLRGYAIGVVLAFALTS